MSTEFIPDDLSTFSRSTNGLSSRLPGFYELPLAERRAILSKFAHLTPEETLALSQCGAMSPELVEVFIENGVGAFSLPMGVATNFTINGRDVLIPMAVEETSVLAAASHGAKLARAGGGFVTDSTPPVMTGQVQLFSDELETLALQIDAARDSLLKIANEGQERLLSRGGGAKALNYRIIPPIRSVILYIDVDTRDAMGANIVNSMCERVAHHCAQRFQVDTGLRILTNLNDKRIARAHCRVPVSALNSADFAGQDVAARIVEAYQFAYHDVYRATTHNKGVMNGIDPVVIATGNDWRAVEAGAHAYCVQDGTYRPMTKWWLNAAGDLEGSIAVPLAVGTVGGVTKLHPSAQAALKLLGSPSAQSLSEIIVAVGLAQNLSALRALASEGIQRGHMGLHQKNLNLLRQGASQH